MSKSENKINLPWVEKYRPNKLDDLVSHEDIIKTISKFIKEDQLPHLLFYGPPGTGKTSTILACAKQLYSPSLFSSMVLELNASDDRGIGIVRGAILTFASTRTIFKAGFKLIILDEADAMTMDAQNALRRSAFVAVVEGVTFARKETKSKSCIIRRFCYDEFLRGYTSTVGAEFHLKRMSLINNKEIVLRITDVGGDEINGTMIDKYLFNANVIFIVYDITNLRSFEEVRLWIKEIKKYIKNPPVVAIIGNKVIEKYTENIRFCIICNYLDKITPAIQSRCTRFRFGPLSPEQILPRLDYVIEEEKVKISEDGKKALLTLANGDMRKVLNVLQSTWLAYKDVTEDNVYTCVGHPLKIDIENIVKWLLEEDFKTAYTNIKELKIAKGLALSDILEEVHTYVHRIELPHEILINLLAKMAEIQVRLSSGTNENVQLTGLISAFQCVREISVS